MFTCAGLKLLRFPFNINPVQLNKHSTGTLPTLMQRYTLAILDNIGNLDSCNFQKSNGFVRFEDIDSLKMK